MPINIAIDGPAGAGKSTAARQLAKEMGYIYVDTGAMYRAIALCVLRAGIQAEDQAAVTECCQNAEVSLEYRNGAQQLLLNGENVTELIRAEEVGNMASAISGYRPVREKLVDLQRELAARKDVVMDGRDIGTCVLPFADLKVYLTASSRVRAERRYKELLEKGEERSLEDIESDIIERDRRDMFREVSPLKQAEDAVLLDSSSMTLEEVLSELVSLAEDAGTKGCCGC